ncbi:MAG: VOC family protein [Candidatus Methylomirabilis sp.]|nr:VOC family protein [Deltaproteobacteria bacterium]
MEPRISLITLGVADVARSRRFYEALGFRASGASRPGVAFFQAGGMALGLYGREALAEDAGMAPEGSGFPGVALAYNVRTPEEVARTLAEAEAAGARVVKPAEDAFWGGRTGYFADPDGHLWEVAWNPHFPLSPDGSLRLPE